LEKLITVFGTRSPFFLFSKTRKGLQSIPKERKQNKFLILMIYKFSKILAHSFSFAIVKRFIFEKESVKDWKYKISNLVH